MECAPRGSLRCFHFSGAASSRSSFLSFFLSYIYIFFIHRTLAKLYYQLLLSKFPTHLATGDAINLKKIINSNFSKTSGGFCFSLFLSFWKFLRGGEKFRAYFFVRDLNICGAWAEFRRIIRLKELPKIWYSPPRRRRWMRADSVRSTVGYYARNAYQHVSRNVRSFGQNPRTLGIYRDRTGTRTIDQNYERPGPKVLIGPFFSCRRWI